MPAGDDRGTDLSGLLDMSADPFELLRSGQSPHPGAERVVGAQAQIAGRLGEVGAEDGGEGLMDVDALDREAQLPGRGEAAADGALDGGGQAARREHRPT